MILVLRQGFLLNWKGANSPGKPFAFWAFPAVKSYKATSSFLSWALSSLWPTHCYFTPRARFSIIPSYWHQFTSFFLMKQHPFFPNSSRPGQAPFMYFRVALITLICLWWEYLAASHKQQAHLSCLSRCHKEPAFNEPGCGTSITVLLLTCAWSL